MPRIKVLLACVIGVLIARNECTPPAPIAGSAGSLTIREEPGRVVLAWNGPIARPMRDEVAAALDRFKADPRRLVLTLNSPGGSVEQGHEVMAVVRDAARLRPLVTHVENGATCASMCVAVYLLGTERTAHPGGHFMFHEASLAPAMGIEDSRKTAVISERSRRTVEKLATDAFYKNDLGGKRVDAHWLDAMRTRIMGRDVWASARQLVDERSGIVDTLTPATT